MDDAFGKFVAILTAIIGLAILAVILSKNSNTPSVLQSFFSGFASLIGAATAPITGSGGTSNLTGNALNSVEGGVFN